MEGPHRLFAIGLFAIIGVVAVMLQGAEALGVLAFAVPVFGMVTTIRTGLVPFPLTHNTNGVTGTDSDADGVRSDIWVYQVARGERVVLSPGDQFSAYLEDDSPAEIGANGIVEIEVRDASEMDRVTVFGPITYDAVKEFQDQELVARLTISEPIEVPERGKIVIVVKDDDGIDASDSRFLLRLHRQSAGPRR